MKYHIVVTILCFTIFGASLGLFKWIGGEFMPSSDRNKILVKIEMPQGTRIYRTLEVAGEIENLVKKIPEATSYLTSIGQNGTENATVSINLIHHEKRAKSDKQIIDELIPKTAKIPDAEINLMRGESMGGTDGDITINIYGRDYQKMVALSRIMKQKMEDSGYFRSVTPSYKTPKDEIVFIPNVEKMTSYGVSNADIGGDIRSAIYGDDSSVYKEAGEEYDINITLDDIYKQNIDDIKEITTISRKGLLPIAAVGEIKRQKAIPKIKRRDKERVITLDGFLSKSSADVVQRILEEKEFSQIEFEDGYGYKFVGKAEFQAETIREISKAALLACILTYMILAAIINSFIHPITIATSIITSISGVLVMLFFSENSINIGSQLAVVMLIGLAVNNAILMLDYALQKIKIGIATKEALWLGAKNKFRAILMTSIAIIFGTAPQMLDINKGKASMGAVIIGGMLGSIFFTFILIPIIFYYFESLRKFFARERS